MIKMGGAWKMIIAGKYVSNQPAQRDGQIEDDGSYLQQQQNIDS